MIRELCLFGEQLRQQQDEGKFIHDALKEEYIMFDLLIKPDGSFFAFQNVGKISTQAEALVSKKGSARFLLDKPEEVLCFDTKEKSDEKSKKSARVKHHLFIEKLSAYQDVSALAPVFLFYGKNKEGGYEKAFAAFPAILDGIKQIGNMAFRLVGEDKRIHEKEEVYVSIISKFERNQKEIISKSGKKRCSICG